MPEQRQGWNGHLREAGQAQPAASHLGRQGYRYTSPSPPVNPSSQLRGTFNVGFRGEHRGGRRQEVKALADPPGELPPWAGLQGPRVCWSHRFSHQVMSRNFYMLTVLEIGHSGSIYTMELANATNQGFCYFAFS